MMSPRARLAMALKNYAWARRALWMGHLLGDDDTAMENARCAAAVAELTLALEYQESKEETPQ